VVRKQNQGLLVSYLGSGFAWGFLRLRTIRFRGEVHGDFLFTVVFPEPTSRRRLLSPPREKIRVTAQKNVASSMKTLRMLSMFSLLSIPGKLVDPR
jgi:hypothetical protein